MNCLLCQSPRVVIVDAVATTQLVQDWQEHLAIDIGGELPDREWVERFQCQECRLEFFSPDLAGSAKLYSELAKRQGYYPEEKWEHRRALQEIHPPDRVVEIGCGSGDFLASLRGRGVDDVIGIEINPTAVAAAQALGRPVYEMDLHALAVDRTGDFDVVCAFQLLEHLPDPAAFLTSCTTLLRPGGRLLIGVPNPEGFLRYRYEVLDHPPHHITRWSADCLRHMAARVGLKVERIQSEPVAEYHSEIFVETHLSRLRGVRRIPKLRGALLRLLSYPRVRNLFRGHTLYGSFVRT